MSSSGIGLGAFPTPSSARMAVGDLLSAAKNANGAPDPNILLAQILQQLNILNSRLSPLAYRQRTVFSNLAIGSTTNPVTINFDTFNGILVGLTAGTVNIILNGATLMQVQASPNPVDIWLPSTAISGSFTFQCDPLSASPASGFIDIMQY